MSDFGRVIGPEPDPEQLFREAFLRTYQANSAPLAPVQPEPPPRESLSAGVMRRWWMILLGVTIGAVAGFAGSLAAPPSYTASITMIVQVPSNVSDTEAQVSTIEALTTSATVLGDMAQAAGADLSPREVGDRLDLSRPTGSAVVEVTITDSDRQRARGLARALLPSLRDRLSDADLVASETGGQVQSADNVTVRSFGAPQIEEAATAAPRFTAIGGALGGGLGLLVAALLSSRAEDLRVRPLRPVRPGRAERRTARGADRRERRAEAKAAKRVAQKERREAKKAKQSDRTNRWSAKKDARADARTAKKRARADRAEAKRNALLSARTDRAEHKRAAKADARAAKADAKLARQRARTDRADRADAVSEVELSERLDRTSDKQATRADARAAKAARVQEKADAKAAKEQKKADAKAAKAARDRAEAARAEAKRASKKAGGRKPSSKQFGEPPPPVRKPVRDPNRPGRSRPPSR